MKNILNKELSVMLKFMKKRSSKIGLLPGSLVHVGEKKVEKTKYNLLDYNKEKIVEKQIENLNEILPFLPVPTVTWLEIEGMPDVDVLQKFESQLGINKMVLEDILNTDHRPKIEDLDDYVYIVVKKLTFNEETSSIESEQISIILGANYVISIKEKPGYIFEHVKNRIRNSKGRIRKMSPDYLAYALIDDIVDNYYTILEKFGELLEVFDETISSSQAKETLNEIHRMKREIILMRKSVWPLRDLIAQIQKDEFSLINENINIYLKDLEDHILHVIDTIDTFREMIIGITDMYLSNISNQMNSVMKVLTIIATIFIPLTFIAGIYGMNFEGMPELKWQYGYPAVWIVMIAVALSMVIYFMRKKWL